MGLTQLQIEQLRKISTATLSLLLFRKGYRNGCMRAVSPIAAGQPRTVGTAFTLRYIPARWPPAEPQASSSRTREVIDSIPPGTVLVIDAMGVTEAGVFGDILLAGLKKRGAVALVTDGVMRDLDDCVSVGLPIWCHPIRAVSPVSIAAFTASVGSQEPIACGGSAVYPGDVIVADADGVVVIPPSFVDEFIAAGLADIEEELWVRQEVERGVPLNGLHPMDAETRSRYDREMAQAQGSAQAKSQVNT